MPLVLADRVRETTTTTGTGTISLAGPVSGFQGFSTAIGNANTTYYTIVDAATGAWEVGLGTYTSAGSTLARTTVLSSSNSDALVSFGAGTKDVFVTQPAERAVYVLGAGTGLAAGAAAFTANGVPYASATNTLTTGSALTFDGTVLGNAVTANATYSELLRLRNNGVGDGTGAKLSFNFSGTERGYVGTTFSSGWLTDLNGTDATRFLLGGSEQMRLTSTGLGIGTSSPTVKLDITGNDRLIRLNATSNNALMRYSQSGTAKFSQGLNDPVGWILFDDVASAYRLVVDYSGNLGIGTSSPGAQLDISTTVSATGAILRLSNQSNAISVDQPHGTIQFFSGDDSSPADTVVSSIISAQATTAPNEGYLKFLTGNNTEKLRIDAAGNLGLGVTPSAWGGAGLPAFQRGSSSFFEYGYNNTIVGSNYYFDGTNNRYFSNGFASYYQQFSGGHAWNTAASGTAGNAITFTQAMTLNASGLLGVGTTSPQNRIDTRDDINYPLSWGSTSAAVGFLSQATGATVIGALSTNALAFYTNAAERMRLDSSGNLGLGVTPSAWDAARKAIQISSTGALVSSSLNTLLGDNWYVDVSADKYLTTGAATLYQLTGGSHRWYNAPSGTAGNAITFTQAMTLDASGNLGVGETSPAFGLGSGVQVTRSGIATLRLQNSAGSNSFELAADSTANGVRFYGLNNAPFVFAPNATERMRLDSSGNLGLGVTPSAWFASSKAFQFGTAGVIEGRVGAAVAQFGCNWYIDSAGTYKYTTTAEATRYSSTSGQHAWHTAASGTAGNTISWTQAMTLDASGNLVIGDTSGTARLEVKAVGVMGRFKTGAATDGRVEWAYNTTDIGYIGADSSTEFSVVARSGNVLKLGAGGSERARITSGGNFLVGTDNAAENAGSGMKVLNTGGTVALVSTVSDSSQQGFEMYSTGAAAYRLYVNYAGTIHATNTTISAISDQRLKENVRDLDVGLNAVLALKPRKFDWKAGKGKDIKGDRGWIAQEFEQVFPDMIDTWRDPAPEGEEPYKAVRADLIPVLVKAIQELKADLDATKAELAALKGA